MIEKISKICWNSYNWSRPSGSDGKSPSKDTYENSSGYGHEEWLLDKAKVIDGYHYGFLQPLNLKTDRHVDNHYKIWLYSITNGQKILIGFIKNAICIGKDESSEVYYKYKKLSWIKEMVKDLESAGVNTTNFKDTPEDIFFNVKFKLKDINLFDDFPVISKKDRNITTTRFKLLDKINEFKFEDVKQKGTDLYSRKSIADTIIDPYHNKIQNTLSKILKKSGDYRSIKVEENNIDLQGTSIDGFLHYFEIKTDTPKNNIRQAIGQLFEYSMFPENEKAQKLIVIGDTEPSSQVKKYINHLRLRTRLNLFYRWVDMDAGTLSEEI